MRNNKYVITQLDKQLAWPPTELIRVNQAQLTSLRNEKLLTAGSLHQPKKQVLRAGYSLPWECGWLQCCKNSIAVGFVCWMAFWLADETSCNASCCLCENCLLFSMSSSSVQCTVGAPVYFLTCWVKWIGKANSCRHHRASVPALSFFYCVISLMLRGDSGRVSGVDHSASESAILQMRCRATVGVASGDRLRAMVGAVTCCLFCFFVTSIFYLWQNVWSHTT